MLYLLETATDTDTHIRIYVINADRRARFGARRHSCHQQPA
jgi:hypothetical protein